MSRLPYLQRTDLDDAGRAVWDALVSTRGGNIVTQAGGLVGPFNARLYPPGGGGRGGGVGGAPRFGGPFGRRPLGPAMTVGAAPWQAEAGGGGGTGSGAAGRASTIRSPPRSDAARRHHSRPTTKRWRTRSPASSRWAVGSTTRPSPGLWRRSAARAWSSSFRCAVTTRWSASP